MPKIKYRIWAAVGCRANCENGKCSCRGITLHDQSPYNFTKYLDRKYPSWTRIIVYRKDGIELGRFTPGHRPSVPFE